MFSSVLEIYRKRSRIYKNMNIFKIMFPFEGHRSLSNKWWHRLSVVLFFLISAISLIFLVTLFLSSFPENKFNINIKYSLEDFTKDSPKSTVNTIPSFIELEHRIGCLENDDSIRRISLYELEKNVCSSDLEGNLKEVADILYLDNHEFGSVINLQNMLANMLDEDMGKRNCFIRTDFECNSGEIVSYERNIIFYLESFLIPIVIVYILGLVLQIIYFKALIYIIYGKLKNN